MALYLDEIWMNVRGPETARAVHRIFSGILDETYAWPKGVTLMGGPWVSNEEPKMILLLDIDDHSHSFVAFTKLIVEGLIERRRLTPIVEWKQMDKLIEAIDS